MNVTSAPKPPAAAESAMAEAAETQAQTRKEASSGDQVAARKLKVIEQAAVRNEPPPGTGKAVNVKA